jgi:predicted HicB family RNase H-like nuclease
MNITYVKYKNIPIDPDLHRRIKVHASKLDKQIMQWAAEALQEKLDHETNGVPRHEH